MVKIREVHHLADEAGFDLEGWLDRLSERLALPAPRKAVLARAASLTRERERELRACGDIPPQRPSAFLTGIEMVEILAGLGLDDAALPAAMLYRAVREAFFDLAALEPEFGAEVTALIRSVLQMAVISQARNDTGRPFGGDREEQAAKVRRMLVSIIDDVRVALIKLAERTCVVRNLKDFPEAKRVRVAREIFDVYAPLAHRLGIGQIKWELEDLAFRHLEPLEYRRIARLLAERRADRERYVAEVVELVKAELAAAGIEGEVTGRAKHIYSIWKKMRRKGIAFSEVYDVSAVRIAVSTVAECYAVLGLVHGLFRHVPDEFDDYIANPKDNGYRSLHTAVIGPRNRVVEIQIRTHEMHREAELGICAHWHYKGADAPGKSQAYEAKLAWLRQVLEWHEEIGSGPLADWFRPEAEADRIYVFTRDGHVVDLPPGATPIDFAYRIHTEVGHRCRGARVNGRMVPLNTPLKTADQVEILTGRQEAPSRDWLDPAAGYVVTARARAKIQAWFRKRDSAENAAAGRRLLEREFRRLGVAGVDLAELARTLHRKSVEELCAALATGDLSIEQLLSALRPRRGTELDDRGLRRRSVPAVRYRRSPFYIYGTGNLLTRVASCCNPLPGEEICGFVTAGRGVSVHRTDCGNLLRLRQSHPERIIEVSWGGAPEEVYAVSIAVVAHDRRGLLSDLTAAVSRMGLSIASLRSAGGENGLVSTHLTVELPDLNTLRALLGRLERIPNVVSVARVAGDGT
ncbi:MAG: GTP pyrophosphokinase [Porticoccaceae bacterium]|nr:MAG: GTP pyrophosphokinase [Porticoccaceae bacterium]